MSGQTKNLKNSSVKRKPSGDELGTPLKKRVVKSRVVKLKASDSVGEWPEYFQTLYKVFKALNAVLALCSSRKNMATTFDGIRRSLESTLRRPIDLSQIAELKVLLPNAINFAYIPRNEHRVNAESAPSSPSKSQGKSRRARSPNFAEFAENAAASSSKAPMSEVDEHVLVLEFYEKNNGKKERDAFGHSVPPTLTPAAMKKLVDKRNEQFCEAVNELMAATPTSDDPVSLLQAAAHDHIPLDPKAQAKAQLEADPQKVPQSEERPPIEAIIEEVMTTSSYREQIVHRRVFEPRLARLGSPEPPLSDEIHAALRTARGIDTLYLHQSQAIDALYQRKHVIVSTSTASGKSVIYQVPLLRFLQEDSGARAIFIYPTKALAQDQRNALEHLLASCSGLEDVKVATYDGDTPQGQRRVIRETASVIFTNFDMLHASVLPHEELWRDFLKNLKLVAVDELHYYHAIFGSHVSLIMRRLRRICAAVGNRRAVFVSCSATIGQPAHHMRQVFGVEDIVEVTEDAAPSGRKDFLAWLPPLMNPADPSLGRKNAMSEATALMRFLMKRGVRVILFCKIRKTCEQAMKMLRQELGEEGRLDVLERVMAYRGGYSPEDRRKIERHAFSGDLLGLVATNALELGIDIGTLDAVIMLGFPFSIASFRQQIGRAGRRARDALAVLVGSDYPIDMHCMLHPDELFERPMGELIVDIENKVVLESHLQCAAHEMPLCKEDEQYFGSLTIEVCEQSLKKDKDGWYHPNPKYLPQPSRHVSIRGGQDETYCAIDVTKVDQPGGQARILEEVEIRRALFELYEGGIFIHQGLTFMVKEVSHDDRIARLVRTDVNYITSPRDFTDIDPVKTYRIREIRGSAHRAHYGRIDIKTYVFGFFKMRNKQVLDAVDLDTAPYERTTTGAWIDVPKETLMLLMTHDLNPAEAIHAAQHAFLNRFPMSADLRTECKQAEKEYAKTPSARKRPGRLIFYDDGQQEAIAVKAFDHVSDTLLKAYNTIMECPCEYGCYKCVESASCKSHNVVSSKLGAQAVLAAILGKPFDEELLPPPNNAPMDLLEDLRTVVPAPGVGAIEGVFVETETKSEPA